MSMIGCALCLSFTADAAALPRPAPNCQLKLPASLSSIDKLRGKVVYADFRGRISVEGEETFIEHQERRSSFARRVLNTLGAEGWELVGVQPLWPAETSYLIFKRASRGAAPPTLAQAEAGDDPTGNGDAPTQRLDPPLV